MALLAAPGDEDRLADARRRALEYLLVHSRVKRSQGNEIYAVWAYGYGLQALARCHGHPAFSADGERIRAKMRELVRALALYQAVDGGWGYLDFRAKAFRPSGDSMETPTMVVSPRMPSTTVGPSTFITSAPKSPSMAPAYGPICNRPRSL